MQIFVEEVVLPARVLAVRPDVGLRIFGVLFSIGLFIPGVRYSRLGRADER